MTISSLPKGSGGFRPAASNSSPPASPAPTPDTRPGNREESMEALRQLVEEIRRQGVKPGKEPKSVYALSLELAREYNRHKGAEEKKLPNQALYDSMREGSGVSEILIDALNTVHSTTAQKYSLTTSRRPARPLHRRPTTERPGSPARGVEDYRRESGATYGELADDINAWMEKKKKTDPGFKSSIVNKDVLQRRQRRISEYTKNDVIALKGVLPKDFGERIHELTHDQMMVASKGTARLPLYEFHPEGLRESFKNFLSDNKTTIPEAASALGFTHADIFKRKLRDSHGRPLTDDDRKKILETYPAFKPTYVALVKESYDGFFPQAPEHKPDFFEPSVHSATTASLSSLDASTTPPPKKPRLGSGSPNTITSIDSPPDLFAPANPTPMALPARGFVPDQNPFSQSVAPPAGMHPHQGGSAFDPTFNPFPVVFGSTVSGYPAAANPYPARPTTPSDSGLETLWPPAPAQAPADTQSSHSLKRKPDDDYEAWNLFIHFPPKIPKP